MLALLQLRIALTVLWKMSVLVFKWTWLTILWTVKLTAGLFSGSTKAGSR